MSSPQPSVLFVAVPLALVGAASFGLASALQQRAAKEVADVGPLSPRLLVELVRRPRWVLATGAVALGLALQVVALAFAPLALVQPLLVTGIVFGTMFSAWLAHRRLDPQVVVGVLAASAGLAAFLAVARPGGGSPDLPSLSTALPFAAVLAGIEGVCLVVAVAARFSGQAHVAALAVATGVCYGLTAGLMKVVTGVIRSDGLFAIFFSVALYVVCVVGPLGFLLSQHTLRQGVLIAPALAIITVVDPLVATAIGVAWLGERVDTSPAALAGQAIAVVVLIGGVGLLAHRGTQARRQIEERAEGPDSRPMGGA